MYYFRKSIKRSVGLTIVLMVLVCSAFLLPRLVSARMDVNPSLPAVTSLSVAADNSSTRILIQATAPLAYSVSRPDARTILLDLLDADAAHLERYYSLSSQLVESVTVERFNNASGTTSARLRILLRAPVRDRVRATDEGLLLEFYPNGSFSPIVTAKAPSTVVARAASTAAPQPPSVTNKTLGADPSAVALRADSSAPATLQQQPPSMAAPKVKPVTTAASAAPVAAESAPPEPQSGRVKPTRESSAQVGADGAINGQVVDQLGGLIVGATVKIKDASGIEKTTTSDEQGRYSFSGLAPGNYTLTVTSQGFADYVDDSLTIRSARREQMLIKLNVAIAKQVVTVDDQGPIGNSLTNRVIRGNDLMSLPVGPGGLEAALRVMAMPATGPNGPQVIVDGFPGGRIPNVNSIREIRINQNPFSAEYARLGFGRVEILTKPGAETFQFSTFFNFNDESLNSRNPFAPNRAAYQSRYVGGSVSGPVISKRSSFFLDFERLRAENNALINATILNPALQITSLSQTVVTPQKRFSFSPRFDYQINKYNTLVARYSFMRSGQSNQGVGSFSLLSRALNSNLSSQMLQLTETAILNPNTINEFRLQFKRDSGSSRGDSSQSTIQVPEAFTGGGASSGLTRDVSSEWQLQNYTSMSVGPHFLKFGGQLRHVQLSSTSEQNFNGMFLFAGRYAPQLNAANGILRDASGQPILTSISGIESYRRTLLFQQQGLKPEEIRALGGGAAQFSINGGNPTAEISQYEASAFIQDDWKVRPNLSLNFGLRYEFQNNLDSHLNFAPRVGFAWSPDGQSKQPKTSVRGGVGLFYDRFSEAYTLAANRYSGLSQQFIVSDSAVLDLFPQVPTLSALAAFAAPQTFRRVASDLTTPYSIQSSISFQQQLPMGLTFEATYIDTRSLHLLRSRNVTAPFLGNDISAASILAAPTFSNGGEIYQYESSGRFNQKQLSLNVVSRVGSTMTLWATYVLGSARGDTEGAESFPAYSYDLRSEYGRSSLDARHNFYLGGWIMAPFGISLNPLIFLRSGTPFDITIGRDLNGDALYTERPAFATDLSSPSVVVTKYGAFDLSPIAGQAIIPRNFGNGPGFFTANLGISKTFSFGSDAKSANNNHSQDGKYPGSWLSSRRYNVTVSVRIENIFNHTNPGLPIGNLSSPLFGRSVSSAGDYGFGSNPAGNRRIEFQIFFNF